jgi:ADP-ribosylglycohydrolase
MNTRTRQDVIAGTLLGTLLGDAIGLPREGLSRERALRCFGGAPLRHRLVLGRGLGSDDTEHACMVAQALLARPEDAGAFARSLAWRLRGWLLSLPAGVGWATLRATVRLWLGFSPERSGVASAGNGPAMRAPVLGVCLADQPQRLLTFTRASSRLTHRDPLAEEGASLVALAAALAARSTEEAHLSPVDLLQRLEITASMPEFREALRTARTCLERNASVAELAEALGLARGVTGYVLHTVPVALYAWLRHLGDFRAAVEAIILAGGDTDSTGAIVGGLAGATVGVHGLPREWLAGVAEWPRSVRWMERLAGRLAEQFPAKGELARSPGPLPLFWPGLVPRNLALLAVVLVHGLRRLLPPY